MTEIRNIILIGKTGNGKSTLANVITESDEFKESSYAVSETKEAKALEIRSGNIQYKIIDTIGIGDTQLDQQEVLIKIAEAINIAKEGISQVLFVSSGRFTREEIECYELLRTILFDKYIVGYTTIVRTRFAGFRKANMIEEDIKKLEEENEEIGDVIKSCRKIIHVNNPSIDTGDDETDNLGLKTRQESSRRLLLHISQCTDVYKPVSLDEINQRIDKDLKERKKRQDELDTLKKLFEEHKSLDKQKQEELEKKIAESEKALKELSNKLAESMKGFIQRSMEKLAIATGKTVLLGISGTTSAIETASKCSIS